MLRPLMAAGKKVVVFSELRATIAYLEDPIHSLHLAWVVGSTTVRKADGKYKMKSRCKVALLIACFAPIAN